MIFLFIIKPRVKKVRNTIHDIPNLVGKIVRNTIYIQTSLNNQTSCKKVRNIIHDIPVDNQTSCKKARNTIHDIPEYNQTSCKKSKKYTS